MKFKNITSVDGGIDSSIDKTQIDDKNWYDCNNVKFNNNSLEKSIGCKQYTIYSLGSPIVLLDMYSRYQGDYNMILATKNTFYKYYNASVVPYGTFTGTSSDLVMGTNAEGKYVFTNGNDYVKCFNGTDQISNLSGMTNCEGGVTDIKAKCILYFNNILLVGNTVEDNTNFPQRIRWSQIGHIDQWANDSKGNGGAGYLDLSENIDVVLNMLSIQDYIVIYKEKSIHVMSYIGGDNIWNKRPAINDIGLLAPNAVVSNGTYHIFIGLDDIYSFDLVTPTKIGTKIYKQFISMLDMSKKHLIKGYNYPNFNEVWFTFVSNSSLDGLPDKILVFNTLTGAWAFRDLQASSFIYCKKQSSESSKVPIFGGNDGRIYNFSDYSGNTLLQSKLFDLDDTLNKKRLLRVRLFIEKLTTNCSCYVTIGTANSPNETITWHDANLIDFTQDTIKADIDLTARYFCIKITANSTTENFRLLGYTLGYITRGEY